MTNPVQNRHDNRQRNWRRFRLALLWTILLGCVTFEHTVAGNVLVPDTLTWEGDETWLMREYREQITTGHFDYPEAHGSTLEVGTGVFFNNMWLTALIYGAPYVIIGGSHIEIGRMLSILLSTILLALIILEGRLRNIPQEIVLVVCTLLVITQSFAYTSHSARYDIITSVAIFQIASWFGRSIHRADVSVSLVAGCLAVACLLISPHVLMGIALLILLAVSWRIIRFGWHHAGLTIVAAFGSLCVVILAYAVAGSKDWTFFGPRHITTRTLSADIGYLQIAHWVGPRIVLADMGRRLQTFTERAPDVLLMLTLVSLLLVPKLRSLRWTSKASTLLVSSSLLLSYCFFEIDNVRSTIYVLPIIAILLMEGLHAISLHWSPKLAAVVCIVPMAIYLPPFIQQGIAGGRVANSIVGDRQSAFPKVAAILRGQTTMKDAVLVDSRAMSYLIDSKGINVMADLFAWHPANSRTITEVLTDYGVRFSVRVKTFGEPGNEQHRHQLDSVLDANSEEVARFVGDYTDYRTSYTTGKKDGRDTIIVEKLLWKAHEPVPGRLITF